jgi:formate dehydrogenase maturation protein FdhE
LLLIKPDPETSVDENSGSTKRGKIYTLTAIAAIAAAILLTFSVFSFMNLQVAQTDNGTLISFGSATPPLQTNEPEQTEAYITKDEFYDMIDELQERNSQVMATALQQTREQHQQQMEDVIQTLTTYYSQRRQQDLVLVSEGLAQLEEETYYKFLQTEQTIEDLIFALNVQQSDE